MSDSRQFQPLSFTGILDATVRLYTQHFPVLLGISLLCHVPDVFMGSLLPYQGKNVLLTLFYMGVAFVTTGWMTGATTLAVSDSYAARPVQLGSALSRSFRLLGRVCGISLMVALCAMGGLICLILPAAWVMVILSLAIPVAVLEDWSGSDALSRSRSLVGAQPGKTWMVVLAVGFVGIVATVSTKILATAAVGITGLTGLDRAAFSNLLWMSMQCAVYPLRPIALTILYYDARIRKEGLDLELQAGRAG